VGTLLLGLTLAAYALGMTAGRGVLLAIAVLGAGVFVLVEMRTASPLIDLKMFRSPTLRASLATSAIVSTVMMATLVVGPFYLSRALGLASAAVGLAMSAGPLMAALAGIPAGRMVDRFGPFRMTIAGLVVMPAGCLALWLMPTSAGLFGYVGSVAVVTAGYALFQAANNTGAMAGVESDQRGVVSGMLNLSRNLGLVTGASAMAAVFAAASGASDVATAPREAVATGMRITFLVAATIVGAASIVALGARRSTDERVKEQLVRAVRLGPMLDRKA
jgi:MFS family permease